MSKYAYKFVVINNVPDTTDAADSLSIQMNKDYGINEWQIVNIMSIPPDSSSGMLIVFQKEISD